MATPDALQRLEQQLDNYQGYSEIETRQQSDKKMRRHLISKIRGLVENLAQDISTTDSTDRDRLESLLSSTSRKLTTIHTSLKMPTYVEEPFFQNAAIPETRLSQIYDLEDNMLQEIDSIHEELGDLMADKKNRKAVEDHFLHIGAYIDNINQALFEREALILGDE